jgi:hypothetical protein
MDEFEAITTNLNLDIMAITELNSKRTADLPD